MPLRRLIGNQSEPLPDEILYQLILEIKEGNDHARDEFVSSFVSIVHGMASKSSRKTKSNLTTDEFFSEGLLAVCVALDRLIEHPKKHVTKYVITSVKYALYSYANASKLIKVPRSTLNRMKQSGETPPSFVFQKLPCDLELKESKVQELEEIIKSSCLTKNEQLAVDLRRKGKLLSEIAPVLGVSVSSVSLMLLDIYKRFLENSSDV